MTKIVVDAELRNNLTSPTELTDESGQTVGFFISKQEFDRIRQLEEDRRTLYEWANSLVTDEELAAAEAEGGEHSFDEIGDFLQKLETLERTRSA